MTEAPDSPWRVGAFRTLFAASALSHLGSNVSYVAIPLLAVTVLDAGPGQAGALAALSTAAFLLIGLPAGAWVDRLSGRRVLVAADAARAVLLASIPLAWWLGVLSLPQLYAVVLLTGCATVFFDVGSQSVLPELVGREHLVPANAAIVSLMAGANIAGRGAGGFMVQLLTAPLAILGGALAYLASACGLTGMARHHARTKPSAAGRRLRTEIADGLRHVFGTRELRALALTATLTNLGAQMVNAMLPVLFSRELHLSAGALGLYWAAGGVGILLGARLARPLAARLGHGRTLALAGPWFAPAAVAVALVGTGPWLWVAGAGWLAIMTKTGIDNVLGVTLRQHLTPDPLLGRMNATFRFLLTGALAVGSALGGLIGEVADVRVAVWAGAVCLAGAFLPVFLSPVRALRELPAPATPHRTPSIRLG
ncbi:MFS transporter [Streptomyces acidiscabies]|uniref:MFS transporter n=2 Tax=Streptomyces acidiscabies TaxID=42234 RepID=A0AAP6BEG2_9ACTN|nr:MFS transporter [Streptomyces acidiscabies]MBP5941932.1 MFS transporter [Streptomyces sp. LBUM 1476]MBZ3913385.1 MFS transporter [Streptomyces acidiscabies]MDX2963189.1 MFS transporter [Streptomyces acidiscabies]MDX3024360.1 MFS transporter [Streptomyces acidiscabies]MDX3795242.1 MFS transporter [Streptomyces acidiscabies]